MVKIFLTDMDGTLTDGGKYLNAKGEEIKKFNVPDGMGLVMLAKMGIQTGIVTSEASGLVNVRGEQLKMTHIITGANNKLKLVEELSKKTGVSIDQIAFIGDDINDYDLLQKVGFAACPADSQDLIKAIPRIRCMRSKGGEGAVREFINILFGAEALLEAWRRA
jgi:3-deoxy-D-manno-octulosonate 8-phosphate phosphatase (KDO 8-P phosphatase)